MAKKIVLAGACRTAIGVMGGTLSTTPATDLGAIVIKEALNYDGPCVIEAIVDENQNFEPKSSSKVLPDGKIVSPSLDDMSPFLDRDEYESTRFNG